jgi:hypothetical protein
VLPELLGFFTYKAAVVGLNFSTLIREYVDNDAEEDRKRRKQGQEDVLDEALTDEERRQKVLEAEAKKLDREFRDKMTWG